MIDTLRLVELLAGALKVAEDEAQETVAGLRNAQLLGSADEDQAHVRLTKAGQALFGEARDRVQAAVTEFYAGISRHELEVAGRVLSVLTTRIEAELENA